MNEKIREFLKSKYKYVIFLIIGILCMLFSFGFTEDKSGTSIEKKLKNTLEMTEGVGDVDVMLTFDENNQVEGAIIVADGARDINIKKTLHDSAVAVLGLPDYKVQILIKKK